jgi:hypothetical protein
MITFRCINCIRSNHRNTESEIIEISKICFIKSKGFVIAKTVKNNIARHSLFFYIHVGITVVHHVLYSLIVYGERKR